MKILILTITLLLILFLSHYDAIKNSGNGGSDILFILFVVGLPGLMVLNIYSCYLLLKKAKLVEKLFIIFGLILSIVYYLLITVFPLFYGTR